MSTTTTGRSINNVMVRCVSVEDARFSSSGDDDESFNPTINNSARRMRKRRVSLDSNNLQEASSHQQQQQQVVTVTKSKRSKTTTTTQTTSTIHESRLVSSSKITTQPTTTTTTMTTLSSNSCFKAPSSSSNNSSSSTSDTEESSLSEDDVFDFAPPVPDPSPAPTTPKKVSGHQQQQQVVLTISPQTVKISPPARKPSTVNSHKPVAVADDGPISTTSTPKQQQQQQHSSSNHKQRRATAAACWWKVWMQDVLFLVSLFLVAILGVGMVAAWKQHAAQVTLFGNNNNNNSSSHNDCIYVSGGGFSGFWYTLGRLKTIHDTTTTTTTTTSTKTPFVCYSAGCLGIFATLSNYTLEHVYDMASTLQVQWKDGRLHRYQVVEAFVDDLLDGSPLRQSSPQELAETLSTMHILTSVPALLDGPALFRVQVTQPQNFNDLKRLLMQTTYIPLAVGSSWTHDGHLDGAFSRFQHPTCSQTIGLAPNAQLLMNILNVNLSPTAVQQLWQLGSSFETK